MKLVCGPQSRIEKRRALPEMARSQDTRSVGHSHKNLKRARKRQLTLHPPPPVFSLGDHRRRVIGPSANLPPDYFNAEGRSPETDRLRTEIRLSLEEEVAKYFRDNVGQVAIFDANVSKFTYQAPLFHHTDASLTPSQPSQNGTKAARIALRQKFEAQGVNVFFIGACNTRAFQDDRISLILASHARFREYLRPRGHRRGQHPFGQDQLAGRAFLQNLEQIKVEECRLPESDLYVRLLVWDAQYAGWNPDDAVKDYMRRIAAHAGRYETMETSGGPFVKIYNIGERLVVNNIRGYLQSRIVFFLMNVHHKKRTIWFARAGESMIEHSFKADSDLSEQGKVYAEKLRDFIVAKRRELLEERVEAGEQGHERRLTVSLISPLPLHALAVIPSVPLDTEAQRTASRLHGS